MQKENWVSYAEVKSAVSMEMVLDRYGVAVRRVNKAYLRGRCPLPTHRSEEHTSELQSQSNLVCRLLLEQTKNYEDVDATPATLGAVFQLLHPDEHAPLCGGHASDVVDSDIRVCHRRYPPGPLDCIDTHP